MNPNPRTHRIANSHILDLKPIQSITRLESDGTSARVTRVIYRRGPMIEFRMSEDDHLALVNAFQIYRTAR